MQIIGFGFNKISAEKNENKNTAFKISSNIKIDNLEEKKIPSLNQDALRAEFNFSVSYGEDKSKKSAAELLFSGFVLILCDKKQQKEFLKQWKKKTVAEELKLPLYNTILARSNLKALQLEEELGLPPHIQMPRISPNQSNNSYTG